MPSDPIEAAWEAYLAAPVHGDSLAPMRAAIVAFLRAIEAQPVAKGFGIDGYIGVEMRKAWAGKLADEVELDGGGD